MRAVRNRLHDLPYQPIDDPVDEKVDEWQAPSVITQRNRKEVSEMGAEQARELYIQAEILAETGDLAELAGEVLAGAEQAGADRGAVTGLIAALRALDPAMAVRYDAGSQSDRRINTGYRSEWEFLEGVSDAEDQLEQRRRAAAALLAEVAGLQESAQKALTVAQADLDAAHRQLTAAIAWPVNEPCTGCHGAKQSAIDTAQAAVEDADARARDARQSTAICETAAEVLDSLAAAVKAVLTCVRRVPQDLGEVYELVHTFLRNGGRLPDYARWIEGTARHGAA